MNGSFSEYTILCTNPWPLNLIWTLAETYKCGAIISQDVRTVFMYERQNTTVGNATGLNLINSTESNSSKSQTVVKEEKINPEMASFTRIVNGEDCPPGECPWQVETLSLTNIQIAKQLIYWMTFSGNDGMSWYRKIKSSVDNPWQSGYIWEYLCGCLGLRDFQWVHDCLCWQYSSLYGHLRVHYCWGVIVSNGHLEICYCLLCKNPLMYSCLLLPLRGQ